jgi:predicted TIM-barrel fold metal-dependent hydrolase
MTTQAADKIETLVVDADSHVIEPADLWTSRVSKKWINDVPRVDVRPGTTTGLPRWHIKDNWMHPPGHLGAGGWKEYPPSFPLTYEEIDPGGFDPVARLQTMDRYGLTAQVIYPNIIGFTARDFMAMEPALARECTRAYNDFIAEFCATDRKRLIPTAFAPFWDLEESVRELRRCRELGITALLFANQYERLGLPEFYDPYWDPIYAEAQELGMSINFHVGFADPEETGERITRQSYDPRSTACSLAFRMILSNAGAISYILTSGICDRFPRLNWVSVESGMGYVPMLLENLDWHWKGHGAHQRYPILPSEYFRRQCYGTFWFETTTLDLLNLYPDNFMFETDFPHPTSLVPGPASPALAPDEHIKKYLVGRLSPELLSKVLHDNAAKVYGLD